MRAFACLVSVRFAFMVSPKVSHSPACHPSSARYPFGLGSLDFEYLIDTPLVAPCANVARCQPAPENVISECRPNHTSSQAQHVDIIMFNTLMGRVGVVAKRRPNATQLVRRDACSNPAAANEHTSIRFPYLQGASNLFGIFREIHRIGVVSSKVQHHMSLFFEESNNLHLQRIPCVVGTDGNTHSASKNSL